MPTGFWAPRFALTSLLCLGLLGAASKTIPLQSGGTLSARAGRNGAILNITGRPNVAATLPLPVDGSIKPGSLPALKLIGEYGPRTILLEDTYYSSPAGLSNCQAGKEQFLRVIALGKPNRQTLRLKLRSCRDNTELADAGVVWKPETGTVEVNWLPNPAVTNARTYAKYQISKAGEIKLLQ